MQQDSPAYLAKKQKMAKLLTIFGRNPVLEALQDSSLTIYRLHLASSNRSAKILDDMEAIAKERGVEVLYHDKASLSRISKNARQDQGVALDIQCEHFVALDEFLLRWGDQPFEIIALDSITNPQNLGMIVRSVCASPMQALLIPDKGCAKLDGLVIKASAGTLFKATVIRCKDLADALYTIKQSGAKIHGLDAGGDHSLADLSDTDSHVFVMGNETEGLSKAVKKQCDNTVSIPMNNGVESLNVAVTASLLAFRGCFK